MEANAVRYRRLGNSIHRALTLEQSRQNGLDIDLSHYSFMRSCCRQKYPSLLVRNMVANLHFRECFVSISTQQAVSRADLDPVMMLQPPAIFLALIASEFIVAILPFLLLARYLLYALCVVPFSNSICSTSQN